MKTIKNFIAWLKGLSVKTTVVLTGIGITLFLAMQQALIGAISSGTPTNDVFAMSFTIWISVMIVTLFFGIILLSVGYISHKIKEKIKTRASNKKGKAVTK